MGFALVKPCVSLTLGENRGEQEEEDWHLGVSPPTGPVRVPMCNVIDYPWREGFSRNELMARYPLSLKHRFKTDPKSERQESREEPSLQATSPP